MPTANNLTVSIIDSLSSPFAEWGVHRHRTTASSYIESRAHKQFRISIIPSPALIRPNPPWHLLASLHLDGKENPEKRMIVWLDPGIEWYRGNGEIKMEGKPVMDAEGKMVQHKWVFQEVGIEALLDELSLSCSKEEAGVPDPEEALVTALQGLGANGLSDKAESKMGMIEVVFQRVTLGEVTQGKYDRKSFGDDDETGKGKTEKDIRHTTARQAAFPMSRKTSFIHFDLVDVDEPPYATFKFFYRSEDVLRKYGFPGFPAAETPVSCRKNDPALGKRNVEEPEDESPTRKKLDTHQKIRIGNSKEILSKISDPDNQASFQSWARRHSAPNLPSESPKDLKNGKLRSLLDEEDPDGYEMDGHSVSDHDPAEKACMHEEMTSDNTDSENIDEERLVDELLEDDIKRGVAKLSEAEQMLQDLSEVGQVHEMDETTDEEYL